MRMLILLGLVCSFVGLRAADSVASVQKGKDASVLLLELGRLQAHTASDAPDGLLLRFLVTRNSGNQEAFTIGETRDAMIAGKSYVQSTQAALGKNFEPETVVDAAPKFFLRHPDAKPPANVTLDRAVVVSVSLHGATLKAGDDVKATLHVGFGAREDFEIAVIVPER